MCRAGARRRAARRGAGLRVLRPRHEHRDVVLRPCGQQLPEDAVTDLVQRLLIMVPQGVGELAEALVEVPAAGLDEAVGVQDQQAAGRQRDLFGPEVPPSRSQRSARRAVEIGDPSAG